MPTPGGVYPFRSSFSYCALSPFHLSAGRSVTDLQTAINRFLEEHNRQSRPFTWTADPDKIIAAVRRGHQVLDSIH
jgi:hypothetical protein